MGSRSKRRAQETGMVWRDGGLMTEEEAKKIPSKTELRVAANQATMELLGFNLRHRCTSAIGDTKIIDGEPQTWIYCPICGKGEWHKIREVKEEESGK